MGEIATKPEDMKQYEQSSFDKLTSSNVEQIEEWIEKIESQGISFKDWAIPGKTISSANLDFARTVCRRAERSIVAVTDQTISKTSQPIIYLNRLSDLLWLMARSVEQSQN